VQDVVELGLVDRHVFFREPDAGKPGDAAHRVLVNGHE
jgi:hypothetical protein